MPIRVMSAFSLEGIGAWRTSRLPLARFLPLAALLAWTAAAAGSPTATHVLVSIVIAFALVAQCRLWDDLVDRDRDRVMHAERVLARAAAIQPFVLIASLLAVSNAVMLGAYRGVDAVAMFVVLTVALGSWYRLYTRRDLLHTHVLLAKYPCFVVLLAVPPFDVERLAVLAASLYFAMCAFELLDGTRHVRRASRWAYGVHAGLLACAAVQLHPTPAGLAAGTALGALLALAWLRERGAQAPTGSRYVPFVCCALTLSGLFLRGLP